MPEPVTQALLDRLAARLGADRLLPAPAHHFSEPRGRYRGQGVVIAPRSTEEVAAIVALAAAEGVGIVPYGGGTGLVGGQIMAEGPAPLVLSLERMTAIRALHPAENVMIVEAGCILSEVQRAAEAAGRLFPLSLASEGSARIGGLLATNAGGANVLRWGNMRALCLGLEVVTARGEVWNGLTRLRKDNAGYDLRDLIIGSEGTLGVITAAALRLVPRPPVTGTALLAVPSPEAALELLTLVQEAAGENVSAFEIMHRQGVDFLRETGLAVTVPLDPLPDWMVLVDLGLPRGTSADALLEEVFAEALDRGLVSDGVIARSVAQARAFWHLRETIPEANRRIGSVSSHDISVPLSAIPRFIETADRAIAALGRLRINCFGHLGDGNLHYNVFPAEGRDRADDEDLRPAIKRTVHDIVHDLGGSVAAEHGVGRLKVADLETYGDPVRLEMMRAVKRALDPSGILNPGAVLRAPDR
ncbi:MAG: FAD-binding oxidoreductase [Rubellimicrobium sp.]|nr:FAD-binding oxidoreductase [Rubellimicrobium sp.]